MTNPFREAKAHLTTKGYRNSDHYPQDTVPNVCGALLIAARLKKITQNERWAANQRVNILLEDNLYLSSWIKKNVPEADLHINEWCALSIKIKHKLQVTRHAWIDWLADQWDQGVR